MVVSAQRMQDISRPEDAFKNTTNNIYFSILQHLKILLQLFHLFVQEFYIGFQILDFFYQYRN
jgi:hypothetical protein